MFEDLDIDVVRKDIRRFYDACLVRGDVDYLWGVIEEYEGTDSH